MNTHYRTISRLTRAFALSMLLPAAVVLADGHGTSNPPEDSSASVQRGEYLVTLLGCGRCHTQGLLTSNAPTGPALAGSKIGIAYTDTRADETPGLVFAPNLTPDPDTGIGDWSQAQLVRAIRTGIGPDAHQRLPVMPWANYAMLGDDDAQAVADYLMSLQPIMRVIPTATRRGDESIHPYVRIGLYQYEPITRGQE